MGKLVILIILLMETNHVSINAQKRNLNFFSAPDSFSKNRFILASSFSGLSYTVFSIGLYKAWYSKNQLTKFHTFDDWKEWKSMDKFGHLYTSYLQSALVYQGARWTGLNNRNAMLWSIGLSSLFQTTIEAFDGYNERWGFSWTDIGANVVGNSIFIAQEKIWKEQKFIIKFSAHQINYDPSNVAIYERVESLYKDRTLERLLKDYNGQTYWLSFNPVQLFSKKSKFWPSYLNLSIGYGVQGLYGGRSNSWTDADKMPIHLSSLEYPRYNQYFLSIDLNLRKIPVKNPFLKSVFSVLNIIKIPAPTLEFNSLRQVKFHYLYF